ncbi:MAG: TolC family protein, partial [Candidatus Omnitrophota bacterium]
REAAQKAREQERAAKEKALAEEKAKRVAEIEAQKQAREQDRAAKEKALAEEKAKRAAEKEAAQKAREQDRAAKEKALAEEKAKREAGREAAQKAREQERAAKEKALAEEKAKRTAGREAAQKSREQDRAAKEKARQEAEAKSKAEIEAQKQAREQERIAREKAQEQERIAREKARQEEEGRRREERAQSYLVKARNYHKENKFSDARAHAKKALRTIPGHEEAIQLVEQINASEVAWKAAEEKRQREEEARRQAEVEAREKAQEEERLARENARKKAEEKQHTETLETLVIKAQENMAAKNFNAAKSYAEKALKIDKDYEDAGGILLEIEEAEVAWAEEQERKRKEDEEREKADREARQKAKDEKTGKRLEKKKDNLVDKSEKNLLKDDYSDARCYALKAQDAVPEDTEVSSLLREVDQAEMLASRKKEDAIRPKKIQKAEKEAAVDYDHAYDGSKHWYEIIGSLLRKKECELGEIQEDELYSVDECVQLALSRNPRYRIASEQVKLAEMRIWESRRDLFPTGALKLERSFGKIGVGSGVGQQQDRHYQGQKWQFELKHVIFDGMDRWFALKQSQANLYVVKQEREKVKTDIYEEVKRAYYSLDKAYKAVDIQAKFKEKLDFYWNIASKAYEQELISKMIYLRAKAESMEADFTYYSAEEDIKIAEMVLFQAMFMDSDQKIRIKPAESPKKTISIGLENCYQLALANRPEVRIKAKMVEYYNFERKMMKAKAWPKIDFQGTFGKAYENYQPLNDPGDIANQNPNRSGRTASPEWYAGIRGSVPIFGNTFEYNYVREKWAPTVSAFRGTETATSYFTLKFLDDIAYFSNLQEAKVGFERAKYEYTKAEQDAYVTVKEVYFKYWKALMNLEISRAQLEQQKTYVDVLEEQLKIGADIDFHRMMDEIVKLAEYAYGVIQSDADYYISIVELNKTIGLVDYFKADYEEEDYRRWEKDREERIAAEERSKKDKEIEKLLDKARNYLSKGKFEYAGDIVTKGLTIDPVNAALSSMMQDIAEAEEAEEKGKREEEEKQLAEEMARRKKQEEERLAHEKARHEEEAKRQAELEAKRKAQEQEQIAREKARQEEAAKRKAEIEAQKQAREQDRAAKEKAREEAEAKRKAELEAQKQAREQDRAAKEKARQEAEAKRKAEIEAQKQAREQDRAAKEKARQEAEAKSKAEIEAQKQAREQERAAKEKALAEEKAKRAAEVEAQKQAREQERAAKEKALAEEKAKRAAEKEAAQKAREQDRAAKEKARQEAEAKRKAEIEAQKQAREQDRAAKEKAREEAEAKRKAEIEAQKQAREQERAAKEKARQEAEAKRKAELEAQKQAREQERAAKEKALAEEKAKREAEKEAAQKAREQDRAAKEKAREEAEAKRKAEIEAQKQAREQDRAAKEKARQEAEAKREAELEAQKQAREQERAAKEKARAEEKAKREAEIEAQKQAREQDRAAKKKVAKKEEVDARMTERIVNYLIKARRALYNGLYGRARKYVERAMQIDPENEKAKELLREIDVEEKREEKE